MARAAAGTAMATAHQLIHQAVVSTAKREVNSPSTRRVTSEGAPSVRRA
jgi:hypothetical protein